MLMLIILGVLCYAAGLGLDKMYRDKLKNQGRTNSYEAQFGKAGFLSKLAKGAGIFFFAMGIIGLLVGA
jgi:hypothetical protein